MLNDNKPAWVVTYRVWSSNRQVPLYNGKRTVYADTEEEARSLVDKYLARDIISVEPKDKAVSEGLNYGDLNRLVEPVFGIDQYKSKMGDDKDVCVINFTLFGKEPANDLANFAEKSYDWVLDADVSSGELSDGNYLVFLEVERTKEIPELILKLLKDMKSIAKMDPSEWEFKYLKSIKRHPATIENMIKYIITSPELYEKKVEDSSKEDAEINEMRAAAGLAVKTSPVTDRELLDLQDAAGIR